MKIQILSLCVVLFTAFSCSKNDIGPKNFLKIDDVEHRLTNGFFEDYGYDPKSKEYDMEFVLSTVSMAEADRCNGNCDAAVIYFDLSGDTKILPKNVFEIDGLGLKYATVYIETVKKNRGSDDFRVVSGTVEIEGSSTSNLSIKINGLGARGEVVSVIYRGGCEEIEL